MQILNNQQVQQVMGGFKINMGHILGVAVAGFFSGGPVGLGFAIGGMLVAQGVNNLEELCHEKK